MSTTSTQTLNVAKRTNTTSGQLKDLRKSGWVPAVIYGLGKEPRSIQIEYRQLQKFLNQDNPNQILELDVDGEMERVLLKEFTRHPVKDSEVTHVDFLRVDDEHPVTVKVPIRHEGTAVGVKTEGGQFSIMKRFVKVKCKAADIPESFTQDVTDIHSGTVIYVKDLQFDKGAFVTPGKTALFGVTAGRKVKEVEEEKAKPEPASEGNEEKKESK